MATKESVVGALSDLRGLINPELDGWAEKAALWLSQWDVFRNEGIHRAAGYLMQRAERTFGKTPEMKAVVELLVDLGERVSDNMTGKNSVYDSDRRIEIVRKKAGEKTGSMKEQFLAVMLKRLEKAKDPAKEMEDLVKGFEQWKRIVDEMYPTPQTPPAPPTEPKPTKPLTEHLDTASAALRKFREEHLGSARMNQNQRKVRRSFKNRFGI